MATAELVLVAAEGVLAVAALFRTLQEGLVEVAGKKLDRPAGALLAQQVVEQKQQAVGLFACTAGCAPDSQVPTALLAAPRDQGAQVLTGQPFESLGIAPEIGFAHGEDRRQRLYLRLVPLGEGQRLQPPHQVGLALLQGQQPEAA
ncbi:hypothetical protein D9M68_632100 [compost metagenome]